MAASVDSSAGAGMDAAAVETQRLRAVRRLREQRERKQKEEEQEKERKEDPRKMNARSSTYNERALGKTLALLASEHSNTV